MVGGQPLWHEALAGLLEDRLGPIRMACAEAVSEVLALAQERAPTLVLADLDLPALDGAALAELVVAAAPAAVVAFDGRMTPANARRALAAGATGYVTKTSSRELIDAAVGLVLAGGSYFPQTAREPDPAPARAHEPGVRLSTRQREVYDLIMHGKTNPEIALALGLALPTVKLHVRGVLRAVGARSRTEAVLRGLRRALGQDD
ncbi:MAG TPA: response regulator transcription factor [Caulobacteraceae bacterium]|nr:response regulator transcription factor [Caulobacteraceae bacterium]